MVENLKNSPSVMNNIFGDARLREVIGCTSRAFANSAAAFTASMICSS